MNFRRLLPLSFLLASMAACSSAEESREDETLEDALEPHPDATHGFIQGFGRSDITRERQKDGFGRSNMGAERDAGVLVR